jgi:hypothetical protein
MDAIDLPFYPTFGFRFDLRAENIELLHKLYSAGEFKRYLCHIHPQLSGFPDMPSVGLADEPGARHSNSRWREWRDEYLAELGEGFPANTSVRAAQREVDLVLSWREAVPPNLRYWVHD